MFSEAGISGTYAGNFLFTWEDLTRVQNKWEIGRVGASYRDHCSAVLYCTKKSQEVGVKVCTTKQWK
jgi:hypothetical protein